MDWNVVAQYLPLFEKAAWLTLRLGLAGIALAIVIGLVCALVQYYLRFWLSICRTSLAVSALRIMLYCLCFQIHFSITQFARHANAAGQKTVPIVEKYPI